MSRVSFSSQKHSDGHISSLCSKVGLLLHWGYCRNCIRGVHWPAFQSTSLMKPRTGTSQACSCCPFCMYTIQNDPAYLNHIVGMHYNANFMCGTCLSAVTSSSQQMKRHINECSGLAPPPMTTLQESACSECSPKKSAPGSKHAGSKKKSRHSEKSQPAGSASQEGSQARDKHITHAASVSQESTAKLSRCHSRA